MYMIKNFEEYKQYRAKTLSDDTTPEEHKKIRNAMKVFQRDNPLIFEKMRRKKWECHI